MDALAYYVHNLDPIIFRFGFITPRWYGFAYLLGFLGAYLLIKKLARDGMLRLHPDRVPDLVLNCCIFGVLFGGRMGYILFYNLPDALKHNRPPMLWHFTSAFPYWDVLRVWEGGMSAHGGVLFTVLTLAYFAWRRKKEGVSLLNIGDAACMVVPLGLCFGRIANFINGELYGHPTTVPWAVKFPSEVYAPTNGTIVPAVFDRLPEVLDRLHIPVDLLMLQLQNRSAEATAAVASILPPRHPSQLYEALLEGLLLFAICWTVGRLWRKDGMASGAFLTLYPVMRILGEQFRVGDSPKTILGIDMSLGVIYSLVMFVCGGAYWAYWIWRDRRVPWIPVAPGEPTASQPPTAPADAGARPSL